jgi:hypothetical protein
MRRFLSLVALLGVTGLPAAAVTPGDETARTDYRIAAMLGQRGCVTMSEHQVTVVPHGFLVQRSQEFVPYEEASPSPDGRYWRCAAGGQRTRFLAPDTTE